MSFFLAIDAGGTKTDYLLADETHVLARVRGGTIKRMRADHDTAAANLVRALEQLTETAGSAMSSVTSTCIGTAGVTVPLVVDWLREVLERRVSGNLLVLSDVEIALDAAFPGEGGVLILAGTGSNVAGRTRSGLVSTVGGWGPVLSDQGSGHRIGEQALRALMLSNDEGGTTSLLHAVLTFWELDSIEALIAYANSLPAPDFSRLTHVVLRCAEAGDGVALAVLRAQGEELAHLAKLMMRKLQADSARENSGRAASWTPPLAFAGSIMENVAPVREALIAAVRLEFPAVETLPGVVDPIEGALARARQTLERSPPPHSPR